jgi:hypothetical protein
MTSTEANHFNALLAHLGIRNLGGLDHPVTDPLRRAEQSRRAREAAAALAERASKALSAGRRRADVERDWPVLEATLEAGRQAGRRP